MIFTQHMKFDVGMLFSFNQSVSEGNPSDLNTHTHMKKKKKKKKKTEKADIPEKKID